MSVNSDFGYKNGKMKNYEDVIAGPSDERRRRSSGSKTRKKSTIPRSSSPAAGLNKKIRVDKRTLSEYRHTCDYLEGQIENLKKQHKDFLELKASNQRLSNHIDTIKMDHELEVERLTKKIEMMEVNLKRENQKLKDYELEQSTEYTTLKSEKM
jgi:predicted RNase H-like nuclease (RuvC/YqgF family)